jgi:hypothetical protein
MAVNADERLKKSQGDDRTNRAMEDRAVTERRDLSDDDRVAMFQQQLFQHALPDLPPIPGYKTIWLSTENSGDPIHRRMMLGYEPVKAEDIPGWDYLSIKTGDWAGCIGVREMLAFKIREELWLRFMRENHHDAPNREGSKVTDRLDELKEMASRKGAAVREAGGVRDMRNRNPDPDFE